MRHEVLPDGEGFLPQARTRQHSTCSRVEFEARMPQRLRTARKPAWSDGLDSGIRGTAHWREPAYLLALSASGGGVQRLRK